jgi:hypothetical protein
MAVAARMCWHWTLEALPGNGELVRLMRVLISIGTGVVVLAGVARLLRVEEFNEVSRRVLRRKNARDTQAP